MESKNINTAIDHKKRKDILVLAEKEAITSIVVERPIPKKPRKRFRIVKRILLGFLCMVLLGAAALGVSYWTSLWPAVTNMSSTCDNMQQMPMMQMDGMKMTGTEGMCPPSSSHKSISIDSLQAPLSAAHVARFMITAKNVRLNVGGKTVVDALTFNGTSPGPTLRVHQGDLVIVTLVNHSSTPTSIHWHGIRVPNSSDGVSGVTQNAVKPGTSYIYRFFANDPGTYWYHSHQYSYQQTDQGLYGALIVDPATPVVHDDIDATLTFHDWVSGSFPNFQVSQVVNGSTDQFHVQARPGQWVRLRLINTGGPHAFQLQGVPFTVQALDGHDLNKPTPLTNTAVLLGSGQRYDLRFQMPQNGAVSLFRTNSRDAIHYTYEATPIVVVGQGQVPVVPTKFNKVFDMNDYGTPMPDTITTQTHFAATYTITLNNHLGFHNGHFGPVYTFNGQDFPNIPSIMVQFNQFIRIRIVNTSKELHPIHIHGHIFTVISHNGKALTGSPVHVDTVLVPPGETYEVGFLADNPGLWMLHCHNLFHASAGMDMMVVYPNISTPYSVGNASGNFPD